MEFQQSYVKNFDSYLKGFYILQSFIILQYGHKPITSKFKEGSYRAHFDKKHCNDCPLRKDCPVIEQKKSYFLKVSEKTLHRSQLITRMGTFEYQELASKRAGIEGIPSVLRRKYKIDHLPVRGEVRVKGSQLGMET